MSEQIAIIGAGSWGMAIARLLANNGYNVTIWEKLPEQYRTIKQHRGNPTKLPGFTLPTDITITDDVAQAVSSSALLVFAVPAQFLREVLKDVKNYYPPDAGIVNLAKGVEVGTLLRMSQVIQEVLVPYHGRIVTLSGPSHAEEVAVDMPTAVVAAGPTLDFVSEVQQIFSSAAFRVYQSNDLTGVELGGSLKNVIALAAGITDGLGMGDNTKGALITRGLAEMVRLGTAMGAKAETFAGLSGLGDLVATCTSRHSRNRFVGEKIGRGETLRDILAQMTMVAEGVETTRSAYALARSAGVEMPITEQVYAVLYEEKSAKAAVAELMERSLKAEVWA